MYQISCPFPVLRLCQVIRHVPRLCVVIRNKYWVLLGRVFIPPANPQAGGPPTVGCPRLLIQYIRSYPPYLEAVSSVRNPRTRHAVVTVDSLNTVNCNHCTWIEQSLVSKYASIQEWKQLCWRFTQFPTWSLLFHLRFMSAYSYEADKSDML
jgi:hypothetical protein